MILFPINLSYILPNAVCENKQMSRGATSETQFLVEETRKRETVVARARPRVRNRPGLSHALGHIAVAGNPNRLDNAQDDELALPAFLKT